MDDVMDMDEINNGFIPRFASYPEATIERNVDDLDRYGRWLAGLIRLWNPQVDTIYELRDVLDEVMDVLGALNEVARIGDDTMRFDIDMTDLPSVTIPNGVDTGYPIWSIDHNGWALVYGDATDVKHIAQIIADTSIVCEFDDCPVIGDLPCVIYEWIEQSDGVTTNDDGFIVDHNGDPLTWGEMLEKYAHDVWGVSIKIE